MAWSLKYNQLLETSLSWLWSQVREPNMVQLVQHMERMSKILKIRKMFHLFHPEVTIQLHYDFEQCKILNHAT